MINHKYEWNDQKNIFSVSFLLNVWMHLISLHPDSIAQNIDWSSYLKIDTKFICIETTMVANMRSVLVFISILFSDGYRIPSIPQNNMAIYQQSYASFAFPSNLLKSVWFSFSVCMQSITLDDWRGSFFFLLFVSSFAGNSIAKPISACLNVTPFKYEIQLLCTAPFRSNVWNDLTFDCFEINCIAVIGIRCGAWKWLGKTNSKYSEHTLEWIWHFSVEKWMSWKWFNWTCHANTVLKTHQFP